MMGSIIQLLKESLMLLTFSCIFLQDDDEAIVGQEELKNLFLLEGRVIIYISSVGQKWLLSESHRMNDGLSHFPRPLPPQESSIIFPGGSRWGEKGPKVDCRINSRLTLTKNPVREDNFREKKKEKYIWQTSVKSWPSWGGHVIHSTLQRVME